MSIIVIVHTVHGFFVSYIYVTLLRLYMNKKYTFLWIIESIAYQKPEVTAFGDLVGPKGHVSVKWMVCSSIGRVVEAKLVSVVKCILPDFGPSLVFPGFLFMLGASKASLLMLIFWKTFSSLFWFLDYNGMIVTRLPVASSCKSLDSKWVPYERYFVMLVFRFLCFCSV